MCVAVVFVRRACLPRRDEPASSLWPRVHVVQPSGGGVRCGVHCTAMGRRMEGAVDRAIWIIVCRCGEACVFLAARAPSLLTVRACVCCFPMCRQHRFHQHEQSNR
jgi:hypothetical protein